MAVVWQLLFSKCLHVPIKPANVLALAMAVWLIYGRLLDVLGAPVQPPLSALAELPLLFPLLLIGLHG